MINEIRKATEETRRVSREIERMIAQDDELTARLKKLGISRSEWEVHLNKLAEPALWEEDR